jgi:fumarylacetoacetate (FAA) hydrolase
MKVAHVREIHGPAGAPWRLAASLDPGESPRRWIDLEVARRRLIALDPRRAHNAVLYRQPLTTLDDALGRGLRIEALADPAEAFAAALATGAVEPDDDALLDAADLAFGAPVLAPPAFRDFYAFEGHVQAMWNARGGVIPENWYRLPVFYLSNTSEIRGPGAPVWAPRGSAELDLELEIGAVVDTPAFDLPEDRAGEAIGGYLVLNDWSARDLQRDEMPVRMGPAKGKDFATTIGPWIVTPDELADAWATGATGPMVQATAVVVPAGGGAPVEITRGSWSDVRYSFGQMLARASADVHIRAGELLGSGTVGGGSLLESRERTLGRFLTPGDEVTLRIERLGSLTTPIVERPGS